MPSLQTHNNSGRKKLVVTKSPEAKQITGKDNKPLNFIEFMAKVEGEDSTVKYSVWSKTLSDFFKLDAVVDCDVVVSDQKNVDPDGNPYKNRKITQVYVDGQPIGKDQQKQWGKSIEVVTLEIDSKFRDTALMQACEMVKADKMLYPSVLDIADKFYRWLKGEAPKIGNPTTDTDKGVKKSPDASSKAKTTPYEDSPAGRSALVSDYVRKGMPLADIYETLGIKTPAEIIDIAEAVKTLEAHKAK